MTYEMNLADARAAGRERGLEEGMAEGRREGMAEGRKEGLTEAAKKTAAILKKYEPNHDEAVQTLVDQFDLSIVEAEAYLK